MPGYDAKLQLASPDPDYCERFARDRRTPVPPPLIERQGLASTLHDQLPPLCEQLAVLPAARLQLPHEFPYSQAVKLE